MDATAENVTKLESRLAAVETALDAETKAKAAAAQVALHNKLDDLKDHVSNAFVAAETAIVNHLRSPRAVIVALLLGIILGGGAALGGLVYAGQHVPTLPALAAPR
jgi:hypothetical protein